MPSKTLMIASAGFLALYGLLLLFVPETVTGSLLSGTADPFMAQQYGAALLGFAALNWVARGLVLGGIYGRAVVAGNTTFFTINAMMLLGRVLEGKSTPAFWAYLLIVAFFTAGFALLLFGKAKPAQG